jgi:site-specific recombinase XerD
MYAKMAVRHGFLDYTKNPFVDLKIVGQKTSRNNLSEHDLKKLEKLKFKATEKHLELIRDLFLFQCYTGLRFSDASRLNYSHVYTGSDGYEIRMISEKEKKTINLPLRLLFPLGEKTLSRPELLIKKYWRTDDKPFFLAHNSKNSKAANNQYTNRELKEIQAKAKLQTPLTNHVGRHTFATFLIWRVPLPIVQELLQHSKVETTMLYVHVGSEAVKQHLKKVIDWV